MKSYGIEKSHSIYKGKYKLQIEEVERKGFTVLSGVFSDGEISDYTLLVNQCLKKQEEEFGLENLTRINEMNAARMPFLQEPELRDLFMADAILEMVELRIGSVFHLHLQNAIVNKGKQEHHQSSWHRDLPYQSWTISKPIAFNAFVCLTDFNELNGATFILPYSQHFDQFPSEEFADQNKIQINAKKGDVLFFDSMCFHRAGYNDTLEDRIGVNNMFVVPILKQQIDIPANISKNEALSIKEKMILGFDYETPKSVADFRNRRLNKTK
jgi:ectoine hydroxylase-related dioxygenase (phytanoyl-CoA dioxygenase family)